MVTPVCKTINKLPTKTQEQITFERKKKLLQVWIVGYLDGAVRVTHRSERVEQVVERPGNDDDVVDVEPEGQHNGGYSNTWERRRSSISVKYEKRYLSKSPVYALLVANTEPLYLSTLPWD